MKNKNYFGAIIVGIIASIWVSKKSQNEYLIPMIIIGIEIIFLIFVIIWRIITNIHTKKYGEEEDVKIENIIITDNNINKYVDILSNNKLNSNSVNDLFEKFTVKVTMKTKTLQLVNGINEVLKNLGYNLSISESDMSKYDYDFIKIRRANNYNTVRHDINTIIKILNNNNLEVINVVKSRNYSTNLSIISFENLERLNKIGELLIWIIYIIAIIFIPLEKNMNIFVIGVIILRLLCTTEKLFKMPIYFSHQIQKDIYILRTVCFISFSIMGLYIQKNLTDSIITKISATIFVLSVIFIPILEMFYVFQRKAEKNYSNKMKQKENEYKEKYDIIKFTGKSFNLSYISQENEIRKLAYIITNSALENCSNMYDLITQLKENNYLSELNINMYRGNANILCYNVNKLLDNVGIKLKITPDMIYIKDSEKIANRRLESIDTIVNDLNIINDYLNEYSYELVYINYNELGLLALLNSNQIARIEELCNSN